MVKDDDFVSIKSENKSIPLNLFSPLGSLKLALLHPDTIVANQTLDYATNIQAPTKIEFPLQNGEIRKSLLIIISYSFINLLLFLLRLFLGP